MPLLKDLHEADRKFVLQQFEEYCQKHGLSLEKEKDAWGRDVYLPHIQSIFSGWVACFKMMIECNEVIYSKLGSIQSFVDSVEQSNLAAIEIVDRETGESQTIALNDQQKNGFNLACRIIDKSFLGGVSYFEVQEKKKVMH